MRGNEFFVLDGGESLLRYFVGEIARDDHHPFGVPDDNIAGINRHSRAADGRIKLDRMQRDWSGGPRRFPLEAGQPGGADAGKSRKPPSVTTPATPRIFRRNAIMSPMHETRVSLPVDITSTAFGGHSSIARRCRLSFRWYSAMWPNSAQE